MPELFQQIKDKTEATVFSFAAMFAAAFFLGIILLGFSRQGLDFSKIMAIFFLPTVLLALILKPKWGLLILFCLILVPLRVPIGSGSVSSVWVVIFILFLRYLLRSIIKGFRLPIKTLTPFFVFSFFISLSLLNAPNFSYGLNKLILWLLSVILLLIVIDTVSEKPEEIRKYVNILFYGVFAAGIAGILLIFFAAILSPKSMVNFLFSNIYHLVRSENDVVFMSKMVAGYHPLLNWTEMDGKYLRNISFFMSPIVAGSFFGMLAPIAMSFYLKMKSSNKWYLFIMYFAILNNLLTLTRGAWLGMAVSLGILFCLSSSFSRKAKVFAVLALFGVGIAVFAGDIIFSRMLAKTQVAAGSIVGRLDFLKDGIEIALNHSLLGVGYANYEFFHKSAIHEYPHNQFVELWAETGLGGLLSYIFILVSLLLRNFKSMSKAETDFDLALHMGITGSVIFFIVHSFFEDMLGAPPVILTFIVIVGIAEANRAKAIYLAED